MAQITIIGLGPGSPGFITTETWDKINEAENLMLRTARHPTVEELKRRRVSFCSYDYVYEEKETFDDVYAFIAEDVIGEAKKRGAVLYGVPGSPLVAEKTVALIRELAKAENIKVNIVAGMSFLEVLYTRLAVDPIDGITIIDSGELDALPPTLPTAVIITQIYKRQVASEAKLSLMEMYPDDYPVTLVYHLGLEDEEIKQIPLYELDRQNNIDHLTSVYLPKRCSEQERFAMSPLVDVMAKLRSPGGCVWDIEQTHQSLRRNLIEEVYEVIEAIDLKDGALLCEELGDLLLQVVFHARMAEETGAFSMQDVVNGITEKLIRRHPHVFGDITVRDAAEVVLNWEAIKKQEKDRPSVLDGVPKDLPSLMRAYKLQNKAAKVGFDWDNISFVWDKIREEIAELKEAMEKGDQAAVEEEFGDCLFSFVNLSRFLKVDAEVALNATNHKFIRRFSFIENALKEQGKEWKNMRLEELDLLWDRAKKLQ